MRALLPISIALMSLTAAPPPTTRKDDVVETLHGVRIADPYRWLENQDAPETRAWLKAQNEYTHGILNAVPQRPAIAKRISEFARTATVQTVRHRAGRYFLVKRSPEQDQPVLLFRQGADGPDKVLIDPNAWGSSKSVSVMNYPEGGRQLVYGIRHGGQDELEVHFLDVDTKKEFGDVLPSARYMSAALTPDGKSVVYARHTPEGPRVYWKSFGSEPREIFGAEFGPTYIIRCAPAAGGKYALITVAEGAASDYDRLYVLRLADRAIIPIVTGIRASFEGEIGGETVYVRTNHKSKLNRVVAIDIAAPAPDKWREVVPESKWNLQEMTLAGGHIAVHYLENVLPKTRLYSPAGKFVREIDYPGIGKATNLEGEWDDDVAFTEFQSLFAPPAILRHSVAKATQSEFFRQQVPLEKMPVTLEQKWFTSKDGTRVPMFVAHRKDRKLDGSNPTIVYGYGGFNLPMTPGFSNAIAWWIEHGGVYVLVNLRGGSEFGEQWHQDGMMAKKQNVFDDFIAASEYMIANKYTSPSKLAIYGGSNGGLLVGAAMTQRPELFRAVVCSVPLLDMVRYHLFKVARYWVPEYGSSEDPAQFRTILKYSPYQNVKDGVKYPATMFITGDFDTRVDPLHARKMAARLQAANASSHPILLHYDTEGGHTQGLPVAKVIENTADMLAFLVSQLF